MSDLPDSKLKTLGVQKAGDLIRQTDSFDKLTVLIERLQREKNTLDVYVKSELETLSNSYKAGLERVNDGKSKLQELQDNISGLVSLCNNAGSMVNEFSLISKISRVYRNCTATKQMIEQLEKLQEETDLVEDMLQSDIHQGDDMPNLLRAHFILTRLQSFRDEAMQQAAKENSIELDETLEQLFSKLNVISDNFDRLVFSFCRNFLELLSDEQTRTLISTFKIIEVEEAADRKARNLIDVRKSTYAGADSSLWNFQGSRRELKNFRERAFEEIENSIQERFDTCWNQLQEPDASLNLEWVISDLDMAKQLEKLTPPEYRLFSFVLSTYHTLLDEFVHKCINGDMAVVILLYLVEFQVAYREYLRDSHYVYIEELDPPLEDSDESELALEVSSVLVNKVKEWAKKVFDKDVDEFTRRQNEPQSDNQHKYSLPGTIILFQMISQQLKLLSPCENATVFFKVVMGALDMLLTLQQKWKETLRAETTKQMNNPHSVVPGLPEYAVALSNDSLKSSGFTESTFKKYHNLIPENFRSEFLERLSNVEDGYIYLSGSCLSTIVALIATDTKHAFSLVFQTAWYESSNIPIVVNTFRDYLSDCKEHLVSGLTESLAKESIKGFVVCYIRCLLNKNIKLRGAETIERIRADVSCALQMFSDYASDVNELKQEFVSIQSLLLGMLDADTNTVADYYTDLKNLFWDVPIQLVELVLINRSDLDRNECRKMIEIIRYTDANIPTPKNAEGTIYKNVLSDGLAVFE
ncbi:exocyst complex subunit Sec6 [Schizosaccharomyces japonicus yFS275]|uniref:Exocyst complex subunit Sec6 n=1 Tax=Schizosaccharomyces japonicus (strain yFS275 / FY16936) TaxID=402676 RepID=B6JZ98_SCHJY|nr:exocyst complex subunit Sec6 [Schizosaccharomyces japonicus yFS275]EEB06866.2 exocyst complex subunit Sec6 [Schizosaccharomyces japonicus yFS275]